MDDGQARGEAGKVGEPANSTAREERGGLRCVVCQAALLCVRQRRRARDEEGARLEKEGWRRREARKGWHSGVAYRESGRVWWCELRVETSLWDGQASRGGENR